MYRRNFLKFICALPFVGLLKPDNEAFSILKHFTGQLLVIFNNQHNKTVFHLVEQGILVHFDKMNYQEMYNLAWSLRNNFTRTEICQSDKPAKYFLTKVVSCQGKVSPAGANV